MLYLQINGRILNERISITKTNIFTANSGFSILEQNIYKQGNHYFGYLVVQKTTGTFNNSTSDTIGSLNVNPIDIINTGGFLGFTQWTTQDVAYVYINKNGNIICNDNNSKDLSFIKIHLDFITN